MWSHCLVWLLFLSLQEKDLVPKLFKLLAPRFETQSNGYTRMARIPNRQNLDRAKMAVLEYKGNPFPPLYPVKKENELTLINQLLKGYREDRAQQISAKVELKPWWYEISDGWVLKCFWGVICRSCRLWLIETDAYLHQNKSSSSRDKWCIEKFYERTFMTGYVICINKYYFLTEVTVFCFIFRFMFRRFSLWTKLWVK